MRTYLTNVAILLALVTLALSVPTVWHGRGCRIVGPHITANGTVIGGSTTCGDKIATKVIGSVDDRTGPASVPSTPPSSGAKAPASPSGCIIKGPVCSEDGTCTEGTIDCGVGVPNQVVGAVDNRVAQE